MAAPVGRRREILGGTGALVVLSLTVAHNILKTCRRLLAGWDCLLTLLADMKTSHKILSIVGVIALTSLTLNAKWFSTWAEEAKGSKPRDQDTYRVVSPNGDIRSVACSADGKTLFVVCANGWVKGPAGKGYGTQFESALFKSTDGGETWAVLKSD